MICSRVMARGTGRLQQPCQDTHILADVVPNRMDLACTVSGVIQLLTAPRPFSSSRDTTVLYLFSGLQFAPEIDVVFHVSSIPGTLQLLPNRNMIILRSSEVQHLKEGEGVP